MSRPPGRRRRANARARSVWTLLATAVALSGAAMIPAAQAAPAPAGTDQTIAVKGGYAEFRHHGEILEVNDGVLDGRGVRAELGGVASSQVGSYRVSDYEADGRPVRVNLSLPEHRRVVLRICYTVGHQRDQCSEWQRAVT
ncbi:MAG: hypothetical protein JST31_12125 [Actinobacteria bacterium]|nr:hypothetical protein [Actinomycetota bacterium]